MSKAIRADWAASTPWSGIQGLPGFLEGPDGNITIADVEGLTQALAVRPLASSLARVAYTGRYSDLIGLPSFGSAAFVDISYFMVAWTARTLQIGEVALSLGVQSYSVVFTTTMNAAPKIELTPMVDADTGELFDAFVQRDSITTTGFTFWLSGLPTANAGHVAYRAEVQDQPT